MEEGRDFMSEDITPKNSKGKWHGYCEIYFNNGLLSCKGVRVNDKLYGYHGGYNNNGSVDDDWTGYYLNDEKASDDNEEGYCYIWEKEEL